MEAAYIPEDIWCSILCCFETRQLFFLRRVCWWFITLINSNRIKKIVDVHYYLSFDGNTIDNLTRLDNIYYDINTIWQIDYSFLDKYPHKIIRLNTLYSTYNLPKLFPQMTNLTFLSLCDNKTIKESDISSLTNIQSLSLRNEKCITGTIFSCLTNITKLCLFMNRGITNECVSKLTNIRHLDLGNNDMITNGALSCLTGITMLNLYHNKLITHKGVSGLTNIRGIDLQNNNMIGVESVRRLTNITYLNLKGNNRITFDSLTNLINLRILDINAKQLFFHDLVSVLSGLVIRESIFGYLKFA